ncbi:MAG: MlaD family protein [Candidatus Bruticola sp.]
MGLSPAAKVGMITMVAFILLGLVFLQIGRIGPDAGEKYHIIFDDVQGLQVRSSVRLSGVRIGYVSDIELNSQNRVDVTVVVTRDEVKLFSSDYFVYTIASNILGDKWLDIKPGSVPEGIEPIGTDEVVVGTTPISLDQLAQEGSQLMEELRGSIAALNEIVGDETFKKDVKVTVNNIRDISSNLKDASGDARQLMGELRVRMANIAGTMENVVDNASAAVAQLRVDAAEIGSNVKHTTAAVNNLVQDNTDNLNTIVMNLRQMSSSLKNTAAALESVADDPQMHSDIMAIAANIRKVSEEVAGIAGDIRTVTGDPQVQEDLRETVHNVREATGSVKRVTQKVEGITSNFPGSLAKGERPLLQANASEELDMGSGKLSTNADVWLYPYGGPLTLRFGLDSIGNENLLNLQAGKAWDNWRLRGGIVRSKVGVGADAWFFDKRLETSLDVYDPRDIKIDVLGKVIFPSDWFVYGGVRDVTDKHNSAPVIGAGKRF